MFETDCNWGADSIRRDMTVRQFLESVPGVGSWLSSHAAGGPPAPYISTVRTVFVCPPISPIGRC